MKIYIDSSILVKLYYPEPESIKIAEWIMHQNRPILFTPFHELEMTNALALKVFREEITKDEFSNCLKVIRKDKKSGILQISTPDWTEVFLEAVRISGKQSPNTGTRSLDIIHVAAALILNCDSFLTNDKRQSVLAEKLGLKSL